MPRQNRVDPFGRLIAVSARGTLLGNRGCLHDANGNIVRRWTTRAWIACRLSYKGRHREIMTPNRWTELFFLDEATALSAGHRPCGECRREDYIRFKTAWVNGNPQFDLTVNTPIEKIDLILQRERVSEPPASTKVMFTADIDTVPDGVFVLGNDGETPWLVWGERLLRWAPDGYHEAIERPELASVNVLTPRSMVAAFNAGYRPQVHSSAWSISGESVPPT
ncbi:MAG TPA: hypothetical protein VHM01_22855 [Alphaproteobacteria bacterium]|nr:hypothetical protein [Alphaproteobacteria bacterium]